MVASGDEGSASRRAQCRRIEVGVAESHRRNAVEGRRRYHAAEGAGDAKARVVGHDQKDVRCALGWLYAGRPIGRGLCRIPANLAFELLRRWRKLLAIDGGGCARRAWGTACLLRGRPTSSREKRDGQRSQG